MLFRLIYSLSLYHISHQTQSFFPPIFSLLVDNECVFGSLNKCSIIVINIIDKTLIGISATTTTTKVQLMTKQHKKKKKLKTKMFTNIYHFDYYYYFLLFFFSTLKPLKKNEMKWIYFRSIQSNRLRINKRCLIICFKSSLGLGLGQDSFFFNYTRKGNVCYCISDIL